MLGFYLISFEVVAIVLFGIFMRTDSSSIDNIEYFGQSSLLLLGYTMYSLNHERFDWSTLTSLLFMAAIAFQWNTLFYAFWTSCLNLSFSATTTITMLNFMSSLQAVLCVLVTILPFLSRMSHTQIFLVALIEIVGYSLNFAVEMLGIKAITCGGGMTIFLFAATFAYFIKMFNFPFQKHVPDSSYSNGTLKLIGVLLMVFCWPAFNVMGTLFDVANVSSTANLASSAYFSTILCLSSAIICSLTVQSFGNRINMHKFSESVFNVKYKLNQSGVLIAACANLIIDPFAGLLLGIVGCLGTVIYQRYGQALYFKGDPEYILVFSFLSAIFSSIFAAGRSARSPTLSDDTYKLGGLQIACLFVSMGFGAIFGLITAGVLKLTKGIKDTEMGQDQAFWIINHDMVPLYSTEKHAASINARHDSTLPRDMQFELRNSPAHNSNSIVK